jgi:serine/threonine protein kinase
MAIMKTDDGPPEADTYATRAPGPESLEAMALASEESAAGGGGRIQGLGLEEFERSLIDCGFLDADGLRAALAETSPDGRRSDAEGLARNLVRLGKLTRYQAAALYQGKGKALLIGPYVVLAKLGSGGMGMVFKARLRDGGPEVALKLLPPSASKHPQAVLRFRREAAILEKLDHPNIVSSHDIGAYNGVHYLVMDYVEGSDLDKVVRSGGPLKVVKAVDCVIQAARGLAAAHERGIVHRDIKPANLLLEAKGVVRILDLGLARITQGDDTIDGQASAPSLTASGIIMGTVDFLPPEQSDDSKRADHRADIYSLGCTLHYLLTGKPPYSGETLMQKLVAHHQKPIPSLVEARPDVPPEIDAIFRTMLAKAPDDRPQSMLEVVKKLEAWREWNGGGKTLRVFDQAGGSKPEGSGKPSMAGRKPEETETYDLQTFVRTELFEPELEDTFEGPEPIPPRKSKKARNLRRKADLALRWLVAAAAIVVLIRFFPKISLELPAASKLAKPAPKVITPTVEEVVPPKVEVAPNAKPESPPPPTPKAAEPEPPEPFPGPPPRFEDGPPHMHPPGEKRPPRPADGKPLRRPGEGRPPRPGDGPPGPPPDKSANPPAAGGTIPF